MATNRLRPSLAALLVGAFAFAGPAGADALLDPEGDAVDVAPTGSEPAPALGAWRDAPARHGYRRAPVPVLTGSGASRRVGRIDAAHEARTAQRWSDRVEAHLRIGATPIPDFRARLLAETGLAIRVWPGAGPLGPTVATIDVGAARFAGAALLWTSPGVQQTVQGRWRLVARLLGTEVEHADTGATRLNGYLLRADVQLGKGLSASAGAADAPDTSESRVVLSRARFGGIAYALADRVAFRLQATHENRRDAAHRRSAQVALTARF